jgi:uncharacterized DUF497 family protein
MLVRFYIDPDTDLPHCEKHGVQPEEALEVLRGTSHQGPGRNETRVAEGQTKHGRYLRVIFANRNDGSIFIITAYDLTGKAKSAFRRRRRKS